MTKRKINSIFIEEKSVKKKRNDKLIELYNFFDKVGFDNYPKIINYDEKYINSEYIERKNVHEYSDGIELIKTVALLHSKTTSLKKINKNKYRSVYEKISGNIEYLKKYYLSFVKEIEDKEFMSPKEYLFIRHYNVFDSALKYSQNSLKKWFKMVENKEEERVCTVHNNLSLNHFIIGDNNYLISFDNYLVDTPVLDLYKFYKKDGYKLNYNLLLKEYNNIFPLTEEEKILLNSLIAIPPKIEVLSNEILDCKNIRNTIIYIKNGIKIVSENK